MNLRTLAYTHLYLCLLCRDAFLRGKLGEVVKQVRAHGHEARGVHREVLRLVNVQ
jgi:hypothetical protein